MLPGPLAAQPATPPASRGYDPLTTIIESRRVLRAERPSEAERSYHLRPVWQFGDGQDGVLFRSLDAVLELPGPNGEGALLLVLDSGSSALHVFAGDGRLLRSLDLSGEGPGKLDHPADLVAMPDGTIGLLAASPARLVCIDAQGAWRGDLDLGHAARDLFLARHAGSGGGRLFLAGQNAILGKSFLAEFDCAAGAALDRAIEVPLESDLSRPRLVDRDGYLLDEKPWAVDSAGRLYVIAERNGPSAYVLEIHAGSGSVVAAERPYPARRRSPREKDLARWRVLGPPSYAQRFAGELVVDEREPDVREVAVREVAPREVAPRDAAARGSGAPKAVGEAGGSGTARPPSCEPAHNQGRCEIWVRTSRAEDVLPADGLLRYDVFSPEGEWLHEAVLLAPPGWPRTEPPCGRTAVHFLRGNRLMLVRGQFEAEYPGFCAEEAGLEIVCCEME